MGQKSHELGEVDRAAAVQEETEINVLFLLGAHGAEGLESSSGSSLGLGTQPHIL